MWDKFYYGVCYFPEHWNPKRHASDIDRIAKCGFNFVRMGEGAWSCWEPEEGKYQFDLFDRVIDFCRKRDVKVILGTPTYCAPAWVSHKYPEVLRWNFERMPMTHGSRRNFNYTSPKYYELSNKLVTALAEHYKGEKQVIAWQLDNEFNCHMDVSYAPSDTIAWQNWLKDKYKTLARLNEAWGTKFWSLAYDAWEQVDLPHPTPTWMNPSMLLDETRFISDCVVKFARSQAKILRKHNKSWLITHNALFNNVNGPDLMKVLDFFSHDQYPLFYKHGWTGPASNLQQARAMSFPFGLLEQQSGPGGQMGYLHVTPRPGQIRLWAWQSILHGAKLLSFFRWRTCPYGAEQHWHGLIDQDDRDGRRIAEAKQLGKEIARLPKELFNAPITKLVAVMRDYDNEANDRRINTYSHEGHWESHRWLSELGHQHIAGDLVWSSSSLSGYRLLVVPHQKITTPEQVARYEKFVKAGGILILGAQSGLKDLNNHVVELPLPGLLRDLAGVEVDEWTMLNEKDHRDIDLAGAAVRVFTFAEKLKPLTAEAIAHWTGDDALLALGPAITCNRVGKGLVYYVGGYLPEASIGLLLTYLADKHDLHPLIEASQQVEAIERRAGNRRFLALMNHSDASQIVAGLPDGRELISNATVRDGELTLDAHDVAIIEATAPRKSRK